MNATYCIDERDKILELPQLLSDINWENAGRRFTKSYPSYQEYEINTKRCKIGRFRESH